MDALCIYVCVCDKLCFEGMEESGSTGLDRVIEEESKVGGLLSNVKYVCITDNYW